VNVQSWLLWKSRFHAGSLLSARFRFHARFDPRSVGKVDVEKTIPVEVQQGHA
jgi:hypothetical protein